MPTDAAVAPQPARTFNRWLIVVGALLVQLCLGAVYAWSVFRKPLETLLGITPTQASLPFSFVLVFFALGTIAGGRLQDRYGPKIVAITGGVLLGLGMILASLAHNITTLVLAYGVVSGIGIGFAYVCPISAGVKWFPDKRGLITGLAVAGFGAGALIVGPLAQALMKSIGAAQTIPAPLYQTLSAKLAAGTLGAQQLETAIRDAAAPALGVLSTFRILGIAYIIVILLGALLLRNPPAGYLPAGWKAAPSSGGVGSATTDYTPGEMLKTVQFWLIWLLYFVGAGSGLMMIGQTSPIAQELAHFSKETAAVGVSALAIFNALGRIFWGRFSDSLGRTKTLLAIYLLNGLAVFSYFLIPQVPFWFWIGIALVGLTFGGYLAIYPAINADFFGTKNAGVNYGFIFMAYGIGGLLSNILAPRVKELTGNYNLAFILSGVLCLVAALMILLVKAPRRAQN